MAKEFRIIAPSRKKHLKAMAELFAETFSQFGFNGVNFARRYFGDPMFDWETSRIGLLGDKLVTHWGVFDCRMRIGSARVRVAGVAGVMTAKRYKLRGLMAKTASDSIQTMMPAGYDLSLLFGLRDFYHRFGYVRAWPARIYHVETSQLPTESPSPKAIRYSPGSMDELDKLYNREKLRMTGTAVRPTWSTNPYPDQWRGYYWQDSSGRPRGYLVAQVTDEAVRHIDSAGDPAQSLRILGRLARRAGIKEVEFPRLHHRSAMARTLRAGNCRLEMHYCKSEGAMVRTVNFQSTLRKLAGELSRRLGESPMDTWRGKLLMGDSRQEAILSINRSSVGVMDAAGAKRRDFKHSIIGGEEIAQLLIGTSEPNETIQTGGIRTRGGACKLAKVLFPAQEPSLDCWDGF